MAKITNPKLFSEQFQIAPKALEKAGLFNPILNLDTKLFIDPLLLRHSKHETIAKAGVAEYKRYFEGIISLLSNSQNENDFAWKNAYKQLPEKEIPGTCLGYGINSISGRSIAIKHRNEIIYTANEIIKLGLKDPELFSLLPLFNEGIGPDTISDITTRAILFSLLEFTAQQANIFGIKTEPRTIYGRIVQVIRNPLRPKSFILLIPRDILRNLPFVEKWEDIEQAARFNGELRDRVNRLLAGIFKEKTKNAKKSKIAEILGNKQAMADLIKVIKECKANSYDFKKDNEGLLVWEKATENINTILRPDGATYSTTKEGLANLVNTIIEQYKFLIENRGLNKLIWKEDAKNHCKESVAQLLFFAVAHCYCVANDVDISPEMDTGNGRVDFKFSKGYRKKVIVEIKYSDNHNTVNGYDRQLNEYLKSEETVLGHYVVLDVGKMGDKEKKLYDKYNKSNSKTKSELSIIDAKIKPSPSKLR